MKLNRAPGNRWRRAVVANVVGLGILSAALPASSSQLATLTERTSGAERVVVATVRSVTPEWRETPHGDRLIVSRIQLVVDETLKGALAETLWLDLEGGTLDGLTLRVSSLPTIQPGERAVFFLERATQDAYTPHLRGQGILKLDEQNVVRGSTLRLDEIRSQVRGMGK